MANSGASVSSSIAPTGSHQLLTTTLSDSTVNSRSFGGKLLARGDSGYISSSPAVTPASNGTSPQTPFKGLPVQFRVASSPINGTATSDHRENIKMQRQIRLGDRESSRPLTVERSPSFPEQQPAFYSSFQQPEPNSFMSSNPDSILRAFICRQSSETGWTTCPHPYCVQTRNHWQHYKTCYSNFYDTCERCIQFKNLVRRHIEHCKDTACPVVMCNNAKRSSIVASEENNHTSSVNNNRHHLLVRSRSFLSQESKTISQQAEEIVQRLDKEKPLLSDELPSSLSFGHPISLSAPSIPTQQQSLPDVTSFTSYQVPKTQGVLSPIAESPVSVGPQSLAPQTFDPLSMSQPPLSIKSNYAYSSYEQDGDNGLPSTLSSLMSSQSEVEVQEKSVYPEQTVLHQLNTAFLTPGDDGFYYKTRDYSANDVQPLGQGGFGSCIWAHDETTEIPFAIKQNNTQDQKKIDSIKTECRVLSRLQYNDHVIRFLGAVLDDYHDYNELSPPRSCKMMMELAENGNLKELLVDEEGHPSPLPMDQSLYYLQQIIKGVKFLHNNGVLHLDIKGPNVLVFDGGRRVKLADFGTAVHINDISSVGKNLVGCTPYYAPPEVIQEDLPHFSADIWGVLCVFVEMLTAKMPGCYNAEKPFMAMMYLIGNYDDSDIEELIPLSEMKLESDIEQIFRDVFRRDASQRPTALELLNHPRISSAHEYESCFDEWSEEEGQFQTDSNHPQEQVDITERDSLYSNDDVSSLPEFASSKKTNIDRPASQDSGIGMADLGGSYDGGRPPLRSTTAPTVLHGVPPVNDASMVGNGLMWKRGISRHDSAFSDMTPTDCQVADVQASHFNFQDFHSLPALSSVPLHDVRVQRSFSMGSTGSSPPKTKRRRPSTIVRSERLIHSNSAPVIRRHSLQLNHTKGAWFDSEVDGARPCLRRTSSEVYVDKGPDIDSPERVKKLTGDKQTDLEGLLASLRLENTSLQCPGASSQQTASSKDGEFASTSSSACSSYTSTTSGSSTGSSGHGKDYDGTGHHGDTPPSRTPGNTFDNIL